MSGQLKHKLKIKGSVLIVVLIFCLLLGSIAKTMMDTSLLQFKMVQNFQESMRLINNIEEKLRQTESKLENSVDLSLPSVTFIQFVPDTLALHESQGVNFYRLFAQQKGQTGEAIQLTTTFCTRRVIEENVPIKTSRLKEFTISGELSSEILVTDLARNERGDFIFLGTKSGDIIKIDMRDNDSNAWRLDTYQGLVKGKIVGTMLAGRHPQAKGMLLYALVEKNRETILQVFEVCSHEIKPYYALETYGSLGQPLLWQGFLLTSIDDNQIAIFDAFTGKLRQIISLETTAYYDIPQAMYLPPQVKIKQPLDKNPMVIIRTPYATKACEAPLLASRLGRKTWLRL
ncbi:MAG: hypothetical protein JSR17_13570 [Proteobacteria bacterium]|nr:hypothetical protein [Pseudomonadota bacterium]